MPSFDPKPQMIRGRGRRLIAFFAFEVFLLGLSINWIWRGLPRARFFWAYWIANLLPLILLGYLAFIFHVF